VGVKKYTTLFCGSSSSSCRSVSQKKSFISLVLGRL
jgi:hypothetical protein